MGGFLKAQDIFSNIIEYARDAFRHLNNVNAETLAAAVAVVVIFAFFMLKR